MNSNIDNIYSFSEEELLCTLLIRENFKDTEISNSFYSMEEILSAILYKYLEKYEKCELTEEELINWLKKNSRYNLLTDLIKNEIKKLLFPQEINGKIVDTTDEFVYTNLEALLEIMKDELFYNIEFEKNYNPKKVKKLPSLNEQDFDIYIKSFLKIVDPSSEWQEIYEKALKNGNIIFTAKDDLETKKKIFEKFSLKQYGFKVEDFRWNCFFSYNEEPYIIIERNYDIGDFCSFIHEFSHFLQSINKNDNKIPPILREYTSTFYELVSIDFLKALGYENNVLDKLLHKRAHNTYEAGIDTIMIFNFMKKVLTTGKITAKEEIETASKVVKLNENLEKKEKEKIQMTNPYYFDATKYSEQNCDYAISCLLKDTDDFNRKYPYVLGSYLAHATLNKVKNADLSFEEIKYLMENLASIDTYDIFKLIGFDVKQLKLKKVNN